MANSDLILPASPEAEKTLAGIFLKFPETFEKVAGKLSASDFYSEAIEKIFRTVAALYVNGIRINEISVGEELKRRGELDAVGGYYRITELSTGVYSAQNMQTCVDVILEKSKRRKYHAIGSQIVKASLNGMALDEFENFSRQLSEISNKCDEDRFKVKWAADSLQNDEPPEWIVDKIFVNPGVSVWHGAPGSS